MKKLSQINEGFLSKTLSRVKSGEERLEDRIESNIDEFEEIDLGFPFVFADRNLVINGEDKFTWEDFESYRSYIEMQGWRLPNFEELPKCFFRSRYPDRLHDYITYKYDKGKVYFESKKGIDVLEIYIDNPYGQDFWCDWIPEFDNVENKIKRGVDSQNARGWGVASWRYVQGNNPVDFNNYNKMKKLSIRLIKDKK